MTARPWRDPVPTDPAAALALLQARVPFNAANLAALSDAVAPRPAQPTRSAEVLRHLP